MEKNAHMWFRWAVKKFEFAFNIRVTHLDAFFRIFPNADSRFVFG